MSKNNDSPLNAKTDNKILKTLDFPTPSKNQFPYNSWRNLGIIMRRCFFVWVHPTTLILFTFIPIACFSIFGLGQEYSNIDLGETTIAGSIMCNMCQYSVVFVAACITARIGTEQATGWTRQIALTPITSRLYGTGRVIATAISCLAMTIITYSYGFATGVRMSAKALILSLGVLVISALFGAVFGLLTGLLIPSDAAQGIVGGGSSLIAIFSGMFTPLEQMGAFVQKLGEFMPMWGYNQLLQATFNNQTILGWKIYLNIAVWTVLLLGIVLALLQRKKS